jgi:hypothetical protein
MLQVYIKDLQIIRLYNVMGVGILLIEADLTPLVIIFMEKFRFSQTLIASQGSIVNILMKPIVVCLLCLKNILQFNGQANI